MEPVIKLLNETAANGNLKLSYVLRTEPDPIRASPAVDNLRTVDLRVIVSNSSESTSLELECIVIQFPIGQDTAAKLSGDPKLPSPVLVTPGNWRVSKTAEENGVLIEPSGSETVLSFEGNPLIFTVPGIRINTKPGGVLLSIWEKPVEGPLRDGELPLEKLEADFPVSSFTATPNTITDLKQTVRLNWTSTMEGQNRSYSLHSEEWRPRDCLGKNECYSYKDGETGVTSLPLSKTTHFHLDVIQAQGGQRTVQKTLSTRVSFAKLTLESLNRLDPSPSGRMVRIGWLASNAVRCSVFVDDEAVDENAPADTYLEADRYYLALPATGKHKIEVMAHGETGARTGRLSLGTVTVKEPISLQISGQYDRVRVSGDGRFALLIPKNLEGADEIIIADLANPKTTAKRIAIAKAHDAAFSSDGRWALVATKDGLIRVDAATGATDPPIKMRAFRLASTDECWSVTLASDDKRAFTLNSGRLFEVELPGGKSPDSYSLAGGLPSFNWLAVSGNGKRFAVALLDSLQVLDLGGKPRPVPRQIYGESPYTTGFTMKPDGSAAVTVVGYYDEGQHSESVRICDLNSGKVDSLALDDAHGAAILPNEREAIIAARSGLKLVNIAAKTVKHWGVVPGRVVAVSPKPVIVVAGHSGVFII